jgi:hypothetical protein
MVNAVVEMCTGKYGSSQKESLIQLEGWKVQMGREVGFQGDSVEPKMFLFPTAQPSFPPVSDTNRSDQCEVSK